jgi:hypothetical protein
VQGLEVELILCLLAHDAEVRPQRSLCNSFGVVVVVLPLHERLHIDCREDPWLMTKLAQYPANKVSIRAGFHTDNARRQGLNERQSLDLATESNFAIRAKANDVEDVFPDVDADRGQGCRGGIRGPLLRMSQDSLCRLSPRGKQPVHPISRHSLYARLMPGF